MYHLYCRGAFWAITSPFSTTGLTLRYDGSPMRIYVDGAPKSSVETYVMCATFQSAATGTIALLPVFACPGNLGARGIVDALRLGELNLNALGRYKGFKLIICISSALAFPLVRKWHLVVRISCAFWEFYGRCRAVTQTLMGRHRIEMGAESYFQNCRCILARSLGCRA